MVNKLEIFNILKELAQLEYPDHEFDLDKDQYDNIFLSGRLETKDPKSLSLIKVTYGLYNMDAELKSYQAHFTQKITFSKRFNLDREGYDSDLVQVAYTGNNPDNLGEIGLVTKVYSEDEKAELLEDPKEDKEEWTPVGVGSNYSDDMPVKVSKPEPVRVTTINGPNEKGYCSECKNFAHYRIALDPTDHPIKYQILRDCKNCSKTWIIKRNLLYKRAVKIVNELEDSLAKEKHEASDQKSEESNELKEKYSSDTIYTSESLGPQKEVEGGLFCSDCSNCKNKCDNIDLCNLITLCCLCNSRQTVTCQTCLNRLSIKGD